MARIMKFYAYNTSVSYKGDVFEPGTEIPLDVIKAIPRANLRVLLGTGQIITQEQREAIGAAQRIADAKDADKLPPIGCGGEAYMEELHLNHGSTAGLSAASAAIKEDRGEAPIREVEDFLDGKDEDFEDSQPAPGETVTVINEPPPEPEAEAPPPPPQSDPETEPDFTDAPSADAVEGESEDPLDQLFSQDDKE